jgi:integrase/recombinase XerD
MSRYKKSSGAGDLYTYLRMHYSEKTAGAYLREIDIFLFNYPDAWKMSYKDLLEYVGFLRKRYSNVATLNRTLSSMKVYYDFLCDMGVRDDQPARNIRLRGRRNRDVQLQDLLSMEELELLFNRAERYGALETRNRVLMSLVVYQALLPREMEAIVITDLNLEAGEMYIRPTPKTSGRTLPLKPVQILLFYAYVQDKRPELLKENTSEKLLIGLRGGDMSGEDITKHIQRTARAVYGRRRVNAAVIRQSVIANLLKAGHDLSVVQAFAGHKYPSSTERYRQEGVETLKAAVGKYHPFGAGILNL